MAPTSLSHAFASLKSVVAGDNRNRGAFLRYRWAKSSSLRRRLRSGRGVNGRPSASASRSKTIRSASVSAASFCTRLDAGWMRWSKSSNENAPLRGTTISPSTTNLWTFSARAASTSSGKYRVSDRPDFDCRKISRPLRKRRQRKPSHFGSYCQPLPVGIWSTESASIGANGGRNLRPPDRRPSWPANVAGGSVEAAKGPDQNQNRNGNAEKPQQKVTAH